MAGVPSVELNFSTGSEHYTPRIHPRSWTSPSLLAIPYSTKLPRNHPSHGALALAHALLPALAHPINAPSGWPSLNYRLASSTSRFPKFALTPEQSTVPLPGLHLLHSAPLLQLAAPVPGRALPGGSTVHPLFAKRPNSRPSHTIDVTAAGVIRCSCPGLPSIFPQTPIRGYPLAIPCPASYPAFPSPGLATGRRTRPALRRCLRPLSAHPTRTRRCTAPIAALSRRLSDHRRRLRVPPARPPYVRILAHCHLHRRLPLLAVPPAPLLHHSGPPPPLFARILPPFPAYAPPFSPVSCRDAPPLSNALPLTFYIT
ncbi:hypothetical protein C8R44DRAFT_882479 [Mycena epipterygia]|nr:hypothetical protein C8R44DRAFT_882479 [Mycena epipterygia]